MMLIVVVFAGWLALSVGPRLIVAAVATALGLVIASRARDAERAILAFARTGMPPCLAFDHQPTRAQRRAMRTALALAIQQTELTSLMPIISLRTRRIVRKGRCWG